MARYKNISILIQYINGAVLTCKDELEALNNLRGLKHTVREIKIGKYPAKKFDQKMIDPDTIQLWYKWYFHHCSKDMHHSKIYALAVRRTLLGHNPPRLGYTASENEIRFKRELNELRMAHKKLAEENDKLRTEHKTVTKLFSEALQLHIKQWMRARLEAPIASDQYRFAVVTMPAVGKFASADTVLESMHYFGTSGKDAVRHVWDRSLQRDPDAYNLYIAELNGDKLTLWWQGNTEVLRYRISKFTG